MPKLFVVRQLAASFAIVEIPDSLEGDRAEEYAFEHAGHVADGQLENELVALTPQQVAIYRLGNNSQNDPELVRQLGTGPAFEALWREMFFGSLPQPEVP